MMDRKRILIVTEALEMNGVLRSLLDFMEAMDKDRYEIDLFCFDAYKPSFVILPSYVRLLEEDPWCYMARAPFSRIFGWALKRFAFVQLVRRLLAVTLKCGCKAGLAQHAKRLADHYDIAVAYSMGMAWPFVSEKVSAEKKILWLHTDYRAKAQRVTWDRLLEVVHACDALVCVSEGVRSLIRAEYAAFKNKVWCVHNVVDVSSVLTRAEAGFKLPRRAKHRIVTIGRYSPPKNQVMIPAIAAELRQLGFVDFEWVMAGPGSEAYKTDDPNLVYLDSLDNPMPLMKSADVYAQPSTYEGWGLTVTEAMCLQRYVVVSSLPSFVEQVTDERRGIVSELDAHAFALAIKRAFDSGLYRAVPPFRCPYTHELTSAEFERIAG